MTLSASKRAAVKCCVCCGLMKLNERQLKSDLVQSSGSTLGVRSLRPPALMRRSAVPPPPEAPRLRGSEAPPRHECRSCRETHLQLCNHCVAFSVLWFWKQLNQRDLISANHRTTGWRNLEDSDRNRSVRYNLTDVLYF